MGDEMEARRKILKQLKMGTTEILILAILTKGDRYGYDISRDVKDRSEGFFEFKPRLPLSHAAPDGRQQADQRLLARFRQRGTGPEALSPHKARPIPAAGKPLRLGRIQQAASTAC